MKKKIKMANENLPTFYVDQLDRTPATQKLILPILKAFPAPPFSRSNKHQITPMERLYNSRMTVVGDYDPHKLIEQGEKKLSSAQTTAIVNRIIEEDTRNRRKRKPIIVQAQVLDPTPQARARIMGLAGKGNIIGKTYRVGQVEATEVVPIHRTDPLWCVRNINSPTDGTMNRFFELAFYNAIVGKLDFDPTCTRRALNFGEIAATVAMNSCLGGKPWTLGELLFLGELVFSEEKYLVNGFEMDT